MPLCADKLEGSDTRVQRSETCHCDCLRQFTCVSSLSVCMYVCVCVGVWVFWVVGVWCVGVVCVEVVMVACVGWGGWGVCKSFFFLSGEGRITEGGGGHKGEK